MHACMHVCMYVLQHWDQLGFRDFFTTKKQLKTVQDYYLEINGVLSFLERCNYHTKDIDGLPSLYKDILKFFNELKTLMRSYSTTKKFLLDGSQYSSGNGLTAILVIQDLLNSNGQFMSYQEFKNKYACKMYFLQSYQVVSTIPKHLATKAKNTVPLFQLDDLTTIYISKAKTRDIYCSFNTKAHTRCDNGTQGRTATWEGVRALGTNDQWVFCFLRVTNYRLWCFNTSEFCSKGYFPE